MNKAKRGRPRVCDCPFEFDSAVDSKFAGQAICTLTGHLCPIEEPHKRGQCERLAWTRAYMARQGQFEGAKP